MPATAPTNRKLILRKRLVAAAGVGAAAVTLSTVVIPAAQAAQPAAAAHAAAPAKKAEKAEKKTEKLPHATKGNTLDEWIKQSLAVMKQHKIPGTYHGIYKNVMRESSGNPNVVNDWDVNAVKGTPSKGLLQVIQPTFDRFHVKGTSKSLTDPVANITAACNYAAWRYGTIDNVNSAY